MCHTKYECYMKPTKNKVFCRNCNRHKMLFETEKKANRFIEFNKEEIQEESGYSPQRSYFCLFCGGWHVTSIKEEIGTTKKEFMYQQYLEQKKNASKKEPENFQSIHQKLISDMTLYVNTLLDDAQKLDFFDKKIEELSLKINSLESSEPINEIELKHARYEIQATYIVKKDFFDTSKKNNLNLNKRQTEEWRKWAEKQGILKPSK